MARFDPLDAPSAAVAVPDMAAGLDGSVEGLRIGISREYFFDVPELDAEVRRAVLAGIDALVAHGADVMDAALPRSASRRTAGRVPVTRPQADR